MVAFASPYDRRESCFWDCLFPRTGDFHYRTRANKIFARKGFFLFVHVFGKRISQALLAKSSVTRHRLREKKCRKHSLGSDFHRIFKQNGEQMAQIFFARACGARREVKYNLVYWRAKCKLPNASTIGAKMLLSFIEGAPQNRRSLLPCREPANETLLEMTYFDPWPCFWQQLPTRFTFTTFASRDV